jgi:hypothetical protein
MITSVNKIWSVTEWGKLNEIIVGDPTGAFVPDLTDLSQQSFDRTPPSEAPLQVKGAMPQSVIDETLEDIKGLETVLQKLGVVVHKAQPRDYTQELVGPDWHCQQESGINIRDLTFIHGDLVIDVASPTRGRYFESFNIRSYLLDGCRRQKSSFFVSMPRPQLSDSTYNLKQPVGVADHEPLLDAANCVRLGNHIIVDTNNTANRSGALWLQEMCSRHFGEGKIKIHLLDKCSPDHMDVIIVPLREGTFLLNPTYVRDDLLPKEFSKWDRIYAPEMEPQGYSIGAPKASNWIGLNVLVIDGEKKLVIVEERQLKLIRVLESQGFEVIPVRWRHGRTWGGGFHCVTLDVNRDGNLR